MTVDDEPLALTQLTTYIERTPFLELKVACSNALEAIRILDKEEVDLIFVDINMPDLNGLDFVKTLTKKPMIIFTTAYSEYALEGFRVNALDYLLKPFSYADFLQSANRAQAYYELMHKPQEEINDYLFVKADYRMVQIAMNTILYIEGMSEYVKICVENSKAVMTLLSMKFMEEKLPPSRFMRVHRSYIVNLSKITSVGKGRIYLGDEHSIPIGEQYKKSFNEYMDRNSLTKE